ncbi:histidine kinase [Paenibacillus sp. MMS20-IR301]|uniref:sensor histidine kinase n=1 Tax=Paenibacillus sp. MMS20-IR301 TaxID=2895946 RepID=UPI0028E44182|nr:histidine kinase [Paenibacillus sp. MMS20-IR301]WNS41830.1 histidine kinase [Paenibacillus sp. MMS20-IR301]
MKKWLLYPWTGRNSIRMKLALGVVLSAIPLLILLHYYNYYTVRVVQNQVSISNHNMISLYMKQIDKGLDTVDQYLLGLASSNYDVRNLGAPSSEDEYRLTQYWVSTKLNTDMMMYKTVVNSMFVYSLSRKELTDSIAGVGDAEYLRVSRYIGEELLVSPDPDEFSTGWFVKDIGGSHYLFRLLRAENAWAGAWVNLSTLQTPLAYINLGADGTSMFLDDRNQPLSDEGYLDAHKFKLAAGQPENGLAGSGGGKYLVVMQHSSKGNFSLAAIIPNATLLQNLPYLNRIVTGITIISILLLPVFFLYLRKVVLVPLNRILTAMKRIGDGNVNTRIEPYPTSVEFMAVHSTFNRMMEQMEELKIHVYEEQLSKQKAELQHLQLQMNPHFFMNTLNLIYSLALDKDYELIKEMTLRLVRYFRYMFRSNLTFVTLGDELEHVRNYTGIHELRYQQQLICRIEAPEQLLQVPVPPLLIQSFVENTLKHAYADVKELPVLEVQVSLDETGATPYMLITVKDEGTGYEESMLALLNKGERIIDGQGNEHIGIWNVWHRLRLLYGDKATLLFTNAEPHGAIVQLKLPLHANN